MRAQIFLFLVAVLMTGIIAGCASRDSLIRDIRETRTAAYDQWVKMRQSQESAAVAIQGKLHLADAVKLAIRQNKELQATLQEREIARGKVIESYQAALPKVNARGTYTRLDEVSSFDVGDVSIALGDVDNYSVDLTVFQPIFRGGAIGAALRAAKLAELLSDESIRAALQGTIYQVALAYYDALLAKRKYEVNQDAVNSARVHLKDVKTKRNHGVASDYDVLRAEVDVSNFRAEMIKQKNNADLAKSRLLKAMGVVQKGDIELADKLEYWPMKPVLEEALKIAHENRPDLYQAELNVRLQKEALKVARSEYWPKIDAFFEELWSKPDPKSITTNEWNDTWNAGVSVNLSIFDGLGREGRVQCRRHPGGTGGGRQDHLCSVLPQRSPVPLGLHLQDAILLAPHLNRRVFRNFGKLNCAMQVWYLPHYRSFSSSPPPHAENRQEEGARHIIEDRDEVDSNRKGISVPGNQAVSMIPTTRRNKSASCVR